MTIKIKTSSIKSGLNNKYGYGAYMNKLNRIFKGFNLKNFSVLLFLFMIVCTGCSQFQGKPVPDEYLSFVGTWEGNGVQFTLTGDGGVSYVKISGNGKFSINAPLKEINFKRIKIGIFIFNKKFTINKPPFNENGKTKMVIDNDLVVKKEY